MIRPGAADCPDCGLRVLFALGPDGGTVALDPDEDGLLVGWQDEDGIARCRPSVPGEQLVLGEYFFRLHDPQCATLAPVIPLTSTRPRRQPATGGRRASAR